MWWRHRLRTIFVCAMLEYAALFGTVMRPEQIRELMQTMNRPTIARENPDESQRGEKP